MIRRTSAALLVAISVWLGLVACASKTKKPMTPDEDNSNAFAELEKNDKDPVPMMTDAGASASVEKPKGPIYPAPFTAEQIRDATKNGRTYRYKVEVPDQAAHEYTITFRKVDQSGAEVYAGSGTPKRMGWNILQAHAEFPKDKVKTHDEKLKTPAGKFECIVYEVAGDNEEVWTYYFAKKLPGAPVFFYCERHGKRLRTTTLVEHIPGK
jgi:hypothetical protein